MDNFNYLKLGVTLFIVGLVLIFFYRNYSLISSTLFPQEKVIISSPETRKTNELDFSKSRNSIAYIHDSEYRPISKDAYSDKPKYAEDDASCSYWLKQHQKNPNGHNKVERDKACNGFIVTNAIRR